MSMFRPATRPCVIQHGFISASRRHSRRIMVQRRWFAAVAASAGDQAWCVATGVGDGAWWSGLKTRMRRKSLRGCRLWNGRIIRPGFHCSSCRGRLPRLRRAKVQLFVARIDRWRDALPGAVHAQGGTIVGNAASDYGPSLLMSFPARTNGEQWTRFDRRLERCSGVRWKPCRAVQA